MAAGRPRREAVAVGFLVLQALAILAWWGLLGLAPASRPWFMATGAPPATLWAFQGADLVLLVGGSLAAAWGLARARRWGWPVLCIQAGASMYAALYCLELWLLDPAAWRGALVMLPLLVLPLALVWWLRPEAHRS